ncbi:hypothetical protein LSTR_LSTR006432 [Laodelphax striatellus]|uniref:RCC1-like domain-containing protein n=1 Tax=Laodelphax striatellus TaxID=195883 RepID=A0A482WX16_LAOST|nr:hypothetical protein LSTR_LSTR006432 [Laodelphax striatellus]
MKLKAWGANNYGQLGVGFISEQCNCPTDVDLDYTFFDNNSRRITSISGGGGHTIITDNCGRLYGCGLNNNNQLTPRHTDNISTFTELDFVASPVGAQITCGWESTLLLSNNGLTVWGSNTYGQLGLKKDKSKRSVDPTCLSISRVAQVSCGLRHTAVLLDNGQLYMCGQGRKGQLGVVENGSPVLESDQLLHVTDLSNVKAVSCGQHHTIALTGDGCVYGWGDNKHFQLGLPVSNKQFVSPTLIASQVPINTKLYAGWTHSFLLHDDGSLMPFGRNSYGQLGNGVTSDDSRLNKPFQLLQPFQQLAVGSEHTIALTEYGSVWSWGWNEHGSCGLNHQDNVYSPTLVQFNNKATLIGSGSAHSFALLS